MSKNAPKTELPRVKDARVGIVTAEWNGDITSALRDSAVETLRRAGLADTDIDTFSVPGAIELTFGASALITTIFELGASYLLEFIFHRQFWTYEGWWGSILDRSCVISSLIFGVFAVIYFKILHPISGKLSRKMPYQACIILSILSILAVMTDLIISVTGLL